MGPAGARGERGPAGPAGLLDGNRIYRVRQSARVAPTESSFVSAFCEDGDMALGGGYRLEGIRPAQVGMWIFDNGPDREGWRVVSYNDTNQTGWNVTYTIHTDVICAALD